MAKASATYGWVGRILRVDLGSGRIWSQDTMPYAKDFIGGRGIAARIAWEELKPGIDAFDPENRLIFMTGPLTGTLAPTSGGRLVVCGAAPQAYPKTHYTRSNMGGFWGAELKYAGFDGIVIQGASDRPVYLWIEDGKAEILDAKELWGRDTFETQRILFRKHGLGTRVACIGPAGENLVRIAVIHSEIENAAGQGGFGAVMGSKKLKAIAIRGKDKVAIARPKEFLEACEYVKKIAQTSRGPPPRPDPKCKACSMSCTVQGCGLQIYKDVQGFVFARRYNGGVHCASPAMLRLVPWEAGFEAAQVANLMGVNHWEIVLGLGPFWAGWLKRLREAGYVKDEDLSIPLDEILGFDSGEFWTRLILKIAYKEGFGRVLAEGIARAADILGKGKEFSPHVAHGFITHWDGHFFGSPRFPYWIVSALNWATESRDPNVHGYAQEIEYWWRGGKGPITMDQIKAIGKRLYGSEKAVALESGYDYKAQPTIWHENNDCIKDSLLTCDQIFPIIFSHTSPDGFGDTGADALLFRTATGIEMDEYELRRVGERIFNLERAIAIREGRRRRDDEQVIPYFMKPDRQGIGLDEEKFRRLMDEFYELRGWDVETGIPTKRKLEELGLGDVAEGLEKAIGRLP
ncbi:hypothetical protein KEJ19_01120 [Candidatus Bathyarchaeota archaeon]|nr:hypothetical protein [Candidatus Bathyarchaeota archaeon]